MNRLWTGKAAKLAGVCAIALVAVGTTPAEAKVTLVFGAYTSEKPLAMVRQLRPSLNEIARRMSANLGEEVEIKMQVAKSYVEGIALLTDGRADFMRLGPASYVTAKQHNAGLGLLAVENKKGKKQHGGVICVKADSDIYNLSQLKGRSFAFGNSRSTLGRYFSQELLMTQGIYARDLSGYDYLGRHDRVGQAVGSGQYDAGALSGSTFKKLVAKGVPIRAIATMKTITRAWATREGMDPRIFLALRQTLLDLDNPKALEALRFDGFLAAQDSDFQAVRDAIKGNPQFFSDKSTASRVTQ